MPQRERGAKRATSQGEETQRHILATALRLFRERGFDATTMRDVARAAGLSLGAAYYYFPSKEAIVSGYYDSLLTEHRARVLAKLEDVRDLRGRLGVVLHTKIDLVEGDRALLGALFRFVGDPAHPLSPLGEATREQRELSIGTIREALSGADVSAELLDLTATALWALQMGVLIYFLYDKSTGNSRTRRLIDGSLDAVCQAIALAALPISGPLLAPMMSLLKDVGLVPTAASQIDK
jgi:AcrR family transcriptional regulator